MKSKLRSLIALLLVVMLIVPSIPTPVQGATKKGDSLSYNLGTREVVMLSQENPKKTWKSWTKGADVYTLEVEDDAFFPYEVQFSYNGKTVTKWFMNPEDVVKVGKYKFGIQSETTGTMVTQLTLDVNGTEVVAYPEKKTFSNKGSKAQIASLMPLEEKYLTVDLSQFTPVELTMLSISSIFSGDNAIDPGQNVSWKRLDYDEDYTIASQDDNIEVDSLYSLQWEMIVGSVNQLDMANVRYIVTGNSYPTEWAEISVYKQGADGSRSLLNVCYDRFDLVQSYDWNKDGYFLMAEQGVALKEDQVNEADECYFSLIVNEKYSGKTIKAYEGKNLTIADIEGAIDITDKIFASDMSKTNAGYPCHVYDSSYVTLVEYEGEKITGLLSFDIRLYLATTRVMVNGLYDGDNIYSRVSYYTYKNKYADEVGCEGEEYILYKGDSASKQYAVYAYYYLYGEQNDSDVTAAFAGERKYSSIAEANAAGKSDIKEQLFDYSKKFKADFSNGVYFTTFVGEDNDPEQKVYYYYFKVTEGTQDKVVNLSSVERALYSGTAVTFTGLRDGNGQYVDSYCVPTKVDSYGCSNFKTIFVKEDVNLSSLAPQFHTSSGVKLYATGSSVPEESGVSKHDFTSGILQYTASAENGEASANYWLQIVKRQNGVGQLYVTSLADEDAKTVSGNEVITSNREVLIDDLHNMRHNMLLANVGTESIPNLGAELVSDVVELDDFWTLKGNKELQGLGDSFMKETSYGELSNMAMLRLKMKDGVKEGTDISGTLTIKSGNTSLMIFTLTGMAGNPVIITDEIPQAVKYVPYGSMIQNNNKYTFNTPSYMITSGKLPAGVELKPNGELYGVPKEAGEFSFTVEMKNSYSGFGTSRKTYTYTVLDNTDENVDSATDEGYEVRENDRLPDIDKDAEIASYLFVSQGIFSDFTSNVYIDGEKLVAGTDFEAESGSTRITIKAQTLKKLENGKHTIGVEFRKNGTTDGELKKAAQNFEVKKSNSTSIPTPTPTPGIIIKPTVNEKEDSNNTENNSNNLGGTEQTSTTTNPSDTDKDSDSQKVVLKPVKKIYASLVKEVNPKQAFKKVEKNGKVYFLDENGNTIKNSFVITPKGNVVYTNKKGAMITGRGFTAKNKNRYYAKVAGPIAVNGFCKTKKGNIVNATKKGSLKTNCVFSKDGKKYVAKKSGALVKDSWFAIGKRKYYCDKNGVLKKKK